MKNQFNRSVEISYALKEKNQTGRSFHTSLIWRKNKLLSIGINSYIKTHPQILNFNYHKTATMHSELNSALKLGLTDCSGLTLINIRINNNGFLDNSCPCRGCVQLINSLNFKNVYYSDKNGEFKSWLLK